MADLSNEELRKEITGKWQYPLIYRTPTFDYHKTKFVINRAAVYPYVREPEYVRNRALYSCDVTTLARTYATKWRAPRRPLQPRLQYFHLRAALFENRIAKPFRVIGVNIYSKILRCLGKISIFLRFSANERFLRPCPIVCCMTRLAVVARA